MKKLICFIGFIIIMGNAGYSQDTIHLWPGDVPGQSVEKAEAEISDKKKGNVTRISKVTDPLITVYEPEDDKKNGAGIIVYPGGGYYILAIDKEGSEIAKWLTDLGYTAYVLQYRVPQKQDAALMDAQRALRMVRSRAEEWSIDQEKIGLLGFSAGGSLAARASTLYDKPMYTPVDKIDSVSCKPNYSLLIYPAYLDKGEDRSLTPELEVDSLTPPMFIFATADDNHANSALVMAGALRDADVPVELHVLPKGGHGYGIRPGNSAAETWPDLAQNWLKKYVLNKNK